MESIFVSIFMACWTPRRHENYRFT